MATKTVSKPQPSKVRAPLKVALPEPGLSMEQDHEWCVIEVDGEWRQIRFHDYDEVYKIPGFYERLFYEVLRCNSPKTVCGMLAKHLEATGTDPRTLCAFDLGAGNGMVGEELARIGVPEMVGVDIIPEAEKAVHRDRPGLYKGYGVIDMANPSEKEQAWLERFKLNCLTCVAALGFGDIPVKAFANSYNLIDDGGWLAFNIKEDFLSGRDNSGFSRLIRSLSDAGMLEILEQKRYQHRIATNGDPLFYLGIVARKYADAPDEMLPEQD